MQEELFFDDPLDALSQVVKALGGPQAVGHQLWPSKPLRSADSQVRDCLREDRAAKFSYDEIIKIMRMARDEGRHYAFYTLCDELGYEHPPIASGKTKSQQIAGEMQKLVDQFKHKADEHAAALAAEQQERRLKAV